MIEVIIKRDGSKEDFEAAKLNKWGEWAAKTLKRVDWSSVVMDAVSLCSRECKSEMLQENLIRCCLDRDSWEYNRMAGKLLSVVIKKQVFGNKGYPHLQSIHKELQQIGLMADLDYTDDEYTELNNYLDNTKDQKSAYFEITQIRDKYALRDAISGRIFETQQYTYMRMAMALATSRFTGSKKVEVAKKFYDGFSNKKINAPTPNYVNLGTLLNGYASCAIYTTEDDAKSLAIGDHIAYTMTCMSAGIGGMVKTRAEGDSVRNGALAHSGKLPYYRALVGAINANKQAGRGGACTTYYNAFDPEVETVMRLKNQRSPDSKKIRGLDYAFCQNKVFARLVATDGDIALFSCKQEPELFESMYAKDQTIFEKLYAEYISDNTKDKQFVKARDLLVRAHIEGFETGRHYLFQIDEANIHNPFKESVFSSNLCLEYISPTKGYTDMKDLYSTEDHGRGEIGLCSLAAINVANIVDDEDYKENAYLALLMIDICIHKNEWSLPHLGVTALSRLNAGVGMVGLAYHMAKNGVKYSSQEGRDFVHELAETHAWHLYNASLQLGKEYGNAPWMHKTLWPDGWLPLDTYNKNVDSVVTVENKRDWESLREAILDNKGLRFSIAINFMPAETSSKASGSTNSVYPIRELTLKKTDDSSSTYWAAPEGERLKDKYEMAWDIPVQRMIDIYSIIQKWCDQSISADLYKRVGLDKIKSDEIITDYLYMVKMGMKTRYYYNSMTSKKLKADESEVVVDDDAGECTGGVCSI